MNKEDFWGFRPWRRHSLVLTVAGCIYLGLGLSFVLADELSPEQLKTLSVALTVASFTVWGIIFAIAGLLVILSGRWPKASEAWGYMILTGLSAGWSAFYVMAYIFNDAPPSSLSAALVWGLLGFIWWAISGLVNPERTMVVVVSDRAS